MKPLSCIILIFLFVSCQKSTNEITDFPQQTQVECNDSITIQAKCLLGDVKKICIYCDQLVMQCCNSKKSFVFINKETGEETCEWGTIGHAENEMSDFGINFTIYDDSLCFMELNQRIFASVPINGILSKDSSLVITKNKCPVSASLRPNQYGIVEGNKILLGYLEKGRLGILNKKNRLVKSDYDYPFDTGVIQGINRGTVFQGRIYVQDQRFAIFTLFSDIFELYEMKSDSIRRLYYSPANHIPVYEEHIGHYYLSHNQCVRGIIDLATNSKNVFLLYSSKAYKDYNDEGSDVILKFDWEGNKICKFILPFRCHMICADNDIMYCLKETEDKKIIYKIRV